MASFDPAASMYGTQNYQDPQFTAGITPSNQGFEQAVAPEDPQNQFQKPFKKNMKRKAPAAPQLNLRCELCAIDFTSQTPYDMHLQGAKHARKLKSVDILKSLQSQGLAGYNDTENTIFRCEPCNVSLNGVLQLQTHLEGTKHKQKTNPKPPEGEETAAKENGKAEEPPAPKVNIPAAPAEVDGPPPAKMQMLSCDVCGITVNSCVQLEQHLQSKKHKAKVEGTPLPSKKWKKKKGKGDDATQEDTAMTDMSIPNITSSFVKGETVTN